MAYGCNIEAATLSVGCIRNHHEESIICLMK